MQLVPRAVNRQRPVTSLRRINSLYAAFVNTRCILCFTLITVVA